MSFDMAEQSGRDFEHTTVLLLMAGEVVSQLEQRKPAHPSGGGDAQKLVEFLREREVTKGDELSGEVTASAEAKVTPGLLTRLLGSLGFGLELRGGIKRS